jgi:hypothetical protein
MKWTKKERRGMVRLRNWQYGFGFESCACRISCAIKKPRQGRRPNHKLRFHENQDGYDTFVLPDFKGTGMNFPMPTCMRLLAVD